MNHDERTDALDREVDQRLRAAFAPPAPATFARAARSAIDGTGASGWPRIWPWAIAAAAVLLVVLFAWQRRSGDTVRHSAHELGAMWAAAYEHAVRDGFGGESCCAPDIDLARLCEERFASKLGLGPAGSVQLLGCYCGDQPTGGCMALLARTNGSPVAVYVLPRDQDPRPELPPGCALEMARRELGPLVLYAVSKSASADTLAEFVVP